MIELVFLQIIYTEPNTHMKLGAGSNKNECVYGTLYILEKVSNIRQPNCSMSSKV